jgi:hypothetical protein
MLASVPSQRAPASPLASAQEPSQQTAAGRQQRPSCEQPVVSVLSLSSVLFWRFAGPHAATAGRPQQVSQAWAAWRKVRASQGWGLGCVGLALLGSLSPYLLSGARSCHARANAPFKCTCVACGLMWPVGALCKSDVPVPME